MRAAHGSAAMRRAHGRRRPHARTSTSCAASAWRPTSAASGAPRCACTSRSRRCPSAWPRWRPRSGRGCSSARRAASTLTPAGRRLYGHARPLLEAADQVAEVMVGIRQTGAVVRLAASHSASEAFVAALLDRPRRAPAARRRARDRQLAGRARAGRRRPRRRRRRRLAAQPHAQPGRARDRAGRRRDRLRGAARPPWAARAHGDAASASWPRRWSCATRPPTRAGPSTRCWRAAT